MTCLVLLTNLSAFNSKRLQFSYNCIASVTSSVWNCETFDFFGVPTRCAEMRKYVLNVRTNKSCLFKPHGFGNRGGHVIAHVSQLLSLKKMVQSVHQVPKCIFSFYKTFGCLKFRFRTPHLLV